MAVVRAELTADLKDFERVDQRAALKGKSKVGVTVVLLVVL